MFEIQRLTLPYRAVDVHVQDSQNQFVATVEEALRCLNADQYAFAIQFDKVDVGFFTLSPSNDDKVEQLRDDNRFTLRTFIIDSRHQGRGHAAKTLQQLKTLTREHFPQSTGIGLTVNCGNITAYKLYEKNGFQTLEDLYLGGSAGPQHIMVFDFGD